MGFLGHGRIGRGRDGDIRAGAVGRLFWSPGSASLQYGIFELSFILILGILLAVARYQTRSLWTPLLMHVVNNSIAMVGMAFEMGV